MHGMARWLGCRLLVGEEGGRLWRRAWYHGGHGLHEVR